MPWIIKNPDLKNDPRYLEGRISDLEENIGSRDDRIEALEEQAIDFEEHTISKDNPHEVNKNQVGLGNVDNVKQAPKDEFDSLQQQVDTHLTDTDDPHESRQQAIDWVQNHLGFGTESPRSVADLNDEISNRVVYSSSSTLNTPPGSWYVVQTFSRGTTRKHQMAYETPTGSGNTMARIFHRWYDDAGWSDWHEIT